MMTMYRPMREYRPMRTMREDIMESINYRTELNMDEYKSSKDVIIEDSKLYEESKLYGFFSHGTGSFIEYLINILKTKSIKNINQLKSLKYDMVITTPMSEFIENGKYRVSLSTISKSSNIFNMYFKIWSFISNKIDKNELLSNTNAQMPNEFFVSELKIKDTILALNKKYKDTSMLDLLNLEINKLKQSKICLRSVLFDKMYNSILFLNEEYKDLQLIENMNQFEQELKEIKENKELKINEKNIYILNKYSNIIKKIVGNKTVIDFIRSLFKKYNINIPIIFIQLNK